MRNLKDMLRNKNINKNVLETYGFVKENSIYKYNKKILDNRFIVEVELTENTMTSKLIELEFMDEYLQADANTTGEYSNTIKNAYEEELKDIINKISTKEIFKNKQSKEIIKYIKNKYNDDLEFLWEKFDDNAIVRNKTNNKWYGIFLVVDQSKLGIKEDGKCEILDILYNKNKVEEIIDNKRIFPGYHMNKKSWITIIIDGRLDTKEICNLIDNSYKLSLGDK